jgi:predicted patatin/cPLA2 family phospholipase
MRGVVAGGMVSALEERGLARCFDSIHGSSAGACAGAYFVAHQARLGTRIYYEDINNRKFIDIRRVLLGRPIMNTHFLIDHVMRLNKALDVDRILSQPGLLHIVATDANSAEARRYAQFRDVEHFFAVLKGTITIPIIAGPPIKVDDIELIDGGMIQQIALRSAIDTGASHILVLMTRKRGELKRPDRGLRLLAEQLLLRLFYSANIGKLYKRRNADINEVLERISARIADQHVRVDSVVRSADSREVDRLTTETELLKQADREAQLAVFRYLDGDECAMC